MTNLIWLIPFGLASGWIINYLADVLPWKRRLVRPTCSECDAPFSWIDYTLSRDCRQCGKQAGKRRWFVFFCSVCGTIALWFYPSVRLGFWVGAGLLLYLAVIAVIDIEHRLILQPTSIFGAMIGVAIGIWLHGGWQTLFGGIAGYGLMLLLYFLGDVFARWIAKIRGTELGEVALGFGDVMLSGVLGLILGWPGVLAGLFFAIMLGGLFSIAYIFLRMISRSYQPFMAMPYAPFLILGSVILLYRV